MKWLRTGQRARGTRVALPFDTTASHLARHRMTDDLLARGVPRDVVDSAEVVLGELVANAVRHGRPIASGLIEVEWRVGRREVTVSVRDGGEAENLQPRPLTQDGFSGRGLAMVERLSDRWIVDRSDGVRVTAALAVKHSA